VSIILRVTRETVAGQLDTSFHRGAMASFARQLPVAAVQLKRCLRVVVEPPTLPAVRVVTQLAAQAQPPQVNVIVGVARHAIARRVLEPGRGVALLTGSDGVDAQQRKSRDVVLEEDIVRPCDLVVTLAAVRPLLSRVDVIVLMARATRGFQLELGYWTCVTAFALHIGMRSAQRKLSHHVVFESLVCPGSLAVTLLTGLPVASAVHIVCAVTRSAVA
jgi:hypothetical protein